MKQHWQTDWEQRTFLEKLPNLEDSCPCNWKLWCHYKCLHFTFYLAWNFSSKSHLSLLHTVNIHIYDHLTMHGVLPTFFLVLQGINGQKSTAINIRVKAKLNKIRKESKTTGRILQNNHDIYLSKYEALRLCVLLRMKRIDRDFLFPILSTVSKTREGVSI